MVSTTARKDILISAGIAVSVYILIWFAARPVLLGNMGLPFGYYGDFNEVKRTLEDTGCVDSLEYGLHMDLTLENFHFRVATKSGRIVLIFFDDNMNIYQICNNPKGILVSSAWHPNSAQCYSNEYISESLKGKGFQVGNIKDMLCNLDEMIPIIESNYKDQMIPVISRYDSYESSQYIHIYVYGVAEKEFYGYSE